jgi:hypothetical protein
VGKFLGKRPVGISKSRWDDNIKMDQGRCYENRRRMELTQDPCPAFFPEVLTDDQVS